MKYAILKSRLSGPHTMQPETFLEKAEAEDFRDELDRRFTQRGGGFTPDPTFHVVELGAERKEP